ncbi:hypothetical protein C8R44DRAFT_988618 [Mycena epipterygia]|nr:hypothetical protein C8R44DRAFT_988618 [Mycena epipterygia]
MTTTAPNLRAPLLHDERAQFHSDSSGRAAYDARSMAHDTRRGTQNAQPLSFAMPLARRRGRCPRASHLDSGGCDSFFAINPTNDIEDGGWKTTTHTIAILTRRVTLPVNWRGDPARVSRVGDPSCEVVDEEWRTGFHSKASHHACVQLPQFTPLPPIPGLTFDADALTPGTVLTFSRALVSNPNHSIHELTSAAGAGDDADVRNLDGRASSRTLRCRRCEHLLFRVMNEDSARKRGLEGRRILVGRTAHTDRAAPFSDGGGNVRLTPLRGPRYDPPHFDNLTHPEEINTLLYEFILTNSSGSQIPSIPASIESPFLAELVGCALLEGDSDSDSDSALCGKLILSEALVNMARLALNLRLRNVKVPFEAVYVIR